MLSHMHAIGYVRVSTDWQAEQGVSLEAQEAKIRAMATVQGEDLSEVMADGGESAKSLNRPGLQRLLALVNAGGLDAVIVAKLASALPLPVQEHIHCMLHGSRQCNAPGIDEVNLIHVVDGVQTVRDDHLRGLRRQLVKDLL
jgi:hypothetical protein